MLTIGAEMRGFGRGLALAAGVADASELDLDRKLGEDKKVAVRAVALLLEGSTSLTYLAQPQQCAARADGAARVVGSGWAGLAGDVAWREACEGLVSK